MTKQMPRKPEPELMDIAAEAEVYAQADFSQVNQAFVDRLVELAGAMAKADALDLGTGPADIPIRLAKARPAWQIVAVDASAAMLDLARQAVASAGMGSRITLLQCDASATHLPTGSFDVIFSNSILHHVNRPAALWAEVRRLARPGVAVLMRDLFRPASADAARQIVATYAASEPPLLQEEYYRSLVAAYTPDEVGRQLRAAGLNLQVATITDRHMDIFGRA